MPSTFTAIAFDRLIEPGAPKSVVKPPNSKLERGHSSTEKKMHRRHLSPSLYATPEVTPVLDSPSSSFPPSPYIVNHKRRGPPLLKSVSQGDVSLNQRATEGETVGENGRKSDSEIEVLTEAVPVTTTVSNPREEVGVNGFHDGNVGSSNLDYRSVGTEDSSKSVAVNLERDCECEGEGFFDPQESMSVTSNIDVEDSSGVERSLKVTTPLGDFYDAWEGKWSLFPPLFYTVQYFVVILQSLLYLYEAKCSYLDEMIGKISHPCICH